MSSWARFDDLTQGQSGHDQSWQGQSWQFGPVEAVLMARDPAGVVDVLAAVEAATAAGHWAFGYLAYEAASGLDESLQVHASMPFGMPVAWFGLTAPPTHSWHRNSGIGVFDLSGEGAGRGNSVTGESDASVAGAGSTNSTPGNSAGADLRTKWWPQWSAADHRSRVLAVKERIAAGETYQCNLTERLRGEIVGDPLALYRQLALGQRGAYNAYLDLADWAILSASPELFFQWSGDRVLTRPMKGTSRRGTSPEEDRVLGERLRMSSKERAENLMIVDLLRNDLSRVARTGTVEVPELFTIERYPTVLQMTSTVTGRLRPEVGLVELVRALFPCGSVTGAPKGSSMRVIAELEPEPRGVYCGAVGFVAPPTAPIRARFNVAIRSAVVEKATGRALYGTGGGITADSDPAAEHDEILAKTAVLSRSAGESSVGLGR